ncbi:MAG: FecCD family ABC transporter permease [Lysinibacillus sp.]
MTNKMTFKGGVLWLLLPLLFGLVALCIGRFTIPIQDVITTLLMPFGVDITENNEMVIWNVRLPRVLMAILIGAGLAVAGATFQSVFANPLASPDTLGVSAGAAFGAALAILFSLNTLIVQSIAIVFGLIAIAVTFILSRLKGNGNMLLIVLAGVIVSAFFTALVSGIKYVADPQEKLPEITYWLMGSLSGSSWQDLLVAAPFILMGIVGIYLLRWRLNILMLSEEEISSMGMRVTHIRWTVILLATMIIAASVSVVGQVGWIGLVIPHIARAIIGTDYRKIIPVCISMGAAFLIVIDTISRSVIAGEVPLSILTAIIGAPLFAFLYFRKGSV